MVAYRLVDGLVTCGLTACTPAQRSETSIWENLTFLTNSLTL